MYTVESTFQLTGRSGYTTVGAPPSDGMETADALTSLWSELQLGGIKWFRAIIIRESDGHESQVDGGPVPADCPS